MALHKAIFFLFVSAVCVRRSYGEGYRVKKPNQNWDFSYPYQSAPLGNKNWLYGSATFYDINTAVTACGFPTKFVDRTATAAVPDPRFSDALTKGVARAKGAACGACYIIKCLDVPRYANTVYCKDGTSVMVRIADYDVPGSRRWPTNHYDLKLETFTKIAYKVAGMVNLKWKRTACTSSQAKWTTSKASNFFWHDVIPYDVPGVGTVIEVWVKLKGKSVWKKGKRLWGTHFSFLLPGKFDGSASLRLVLGEKAGTILAKYVDRNAV